MSTNQDLLIERLLAGDIDFDHRELRLACANPSFAQRLDEILRLREGLDEESVLAEARADQVSATRPSLLEQRLDSLVSENLAHKSSPRRPWLKPLLATAVAACLLLAWQPFGGASEPGIGEYSLGGKTFQCLPAALSGEGFGQLAWDNPDEGGNYTVQVFDEENDEPLMEPVTLSGDAREYRHDQAEVATWPDMIVWELTWAPTFGDPGRSVGRTASRPPK